jgi:DNA (cytosine-5)-methyltransferase 1
VMENVSGLVKGKMKLIFAEIMRELKESGYTISARLMNTMYFGVPQNRQRVIFIGVRDDLEIMPGHPRARQKPVTARQAIGHLPAGEPGDHEPQVLAAWRACKPGQALRKAVKYVGSFNSSRLDPNRPSTTQVKTHLNWHYAVPRQLTTLEAALVQSFPPGFRWAGTKGQVKEAIGNSVPPLFMRAVALHIREEILARVEAEACV